MKSKVYFTKEINSEALVKLYYQLGVSLEGKVAVKLSTGEPGGHHYLSPRLIQDLVHLVQGTIVECNTAYGGKRDHTEDHLQAAKDHGFMDIASVDIMDSEGDISLPVVGGTHLQENFVGKSLQTYDSILVLSHFKGHEMGGFGGALKNISIGIASTRGKCLIHSAGKVETVEEVWSHLPEQVVFVESMAEAAKSVVDFKENMLYINVMNLLSIDCDCSNHPLPPQMSDIGVLASTDPVALDQACVDLIYQSTDMGKKDLIDRIEKQYGKVILEHAEKLGIGSREYELVSIDEAE